MNFVHWMTIAHSEIHSFLVICKVGIPILQILVTNCEITITFVNRSPCKFSLFFFRKFFEKSPTVFKIGSKLCPLKTMINDRKEAHCLENLFYSTTNFQFLFPIFTK
eukprot:TRINITY_DN973_c0_g1_i1.p1 TRINITY_DN973_c0_g1~~TRINITY_DN973_c0_g1_i1.p1  ORF type:complete len:107 (+),score=12.63 TRINITY_DN973_c0_g1_i1:111-431(+)